MSDHATEGRSLQPRKDVLHLAWETCVKRPHPTAWANCAEDIKLTNIQMELERLQVLRREALPSLPGFLD